MSIILLLLVLLPHSICTIDVVPFVSYSKYSSIKLGKPDEKPEFNDVTWFMMLFACGIGVGLFFYGVAEPIFYYTGQNRYSADPTMPDNTLAQISINLVLYHWGKLHNTPYFDSFSYYKDQNFT